MPTGTNQATQRRKEKKIPDSSGGQIRRTGGEGTTIVLCMAIHSSSMIDLMVLMWWTVDLPDFPLRTHDLPDVAAEFNPSSERKPHYHPGGYASKCEEVQAGKKQKIEIKIAATAEKNILHPLGRDCQFWGSKRCGLGMIVGVRIQYSK